MAKVLKFAEDDPNDLVIQLGTATNPQDTTGWSSASILLRDLDTNEQMAAGTTSFLNPRTGGQVSRAWESGEKVAGRKFVAECVTVDADGVEATWPGETELPLHIHIIPRRTTPV